MSQKTHFSTFAHSKMAALTILAPDPVFGTQAAFKSDPREDKVNLSIGVLNNSEGSLYRFKAVELAEQKVVAKNLSKGYLPITGIPAYAEHVKTLFARGKEESLLAVQTLGASGALYVAAELLKRSHIFSVFVPTHTWVNHKPMFSAAGLDVHEFPYYDVEKGEIAFSKMCDAIRKMPEDSAIILQPSCQNPTGMDLQIHHFHTLSPLLKEKNITVIFDIAYQGLGKSLEDDVKGVEIFLNEGHRVMITTTFSKNFGLYNDRVGALLIHDDLSLFPAIKSHIQSIIRTSYSSPPAHGAHIVSTVFEDTRLLHLWHKELHAVCNELQHKRKLLVDALEQKKPNFHYQHILRTNGLFALLDLSKDEVEKLKKEYGVYVALDGRICVSAISENRVEQIAEALAKVTQ